MKDLLGMRPAFVQWAFVKSLENGLPIRRPRRKQQLKNYDCRLQKCFEKYDNGDYSRMQFLRAVSHSIKHAQPLQIPHSFWLSVNFTEQFWHSVTRNISVKFTVSVNLLTTALMTLTLSTTQITRPTTTTRLLPQFELPSPSPPSQTHLIAVKSVCFKNVKMWLWCRAGILDSVAVAQTLSHPWIVVARYVVHPFIWCCAYFVKMTFCSLLLWT